MSIYACMFTTSAHIKKCGCVCIGGWDSESLSEGWRVHGCWCAGLGGMGGWAVNPPLNTSKIGRHQLNFIGEQMKDN